MGTVGHRGRGLRTVLNETLRQIETVTGIVAIHAIVPMRIAAAAAVNAQPALRPGRSYVKDTAGCAIGAHSASDGSRPAWCSEMGRGRPFSHLTGRPPWSDALRWTNPPRVAAISAAASSPRSSVRRV